MVYNFDQEKPVVWIGSSRKAVRAFPADARAHVGRALYRLQLGRDPVHWRPMPTVGDGVREIRVRSSAEGGMATYRVIYVARHPEAVYVLHTFQKKTRKTRKGDLDLARQRYREMLVIRRQKERDHGG